MELIPSVDMLLVVKFNSLNLTYQEKANEMYPGLFKPIIVRNSR